MKISTQSPSRPRWQHPEDPPGPARYVLEHLGFRRQEARVLGPPARSMGRPRLMAIHGAGADYTQLNPLLYGLQQRGVGSLAMNLSGHSDAGGGAPAMVSVDFNVKEALRFGERLKPGLLALLAVDMGAMVALRAAQVHALSLHRLVLIDPFFYPDTAFTRPLSQVLTCPSLRWEETTLLNCLQQYKGQVMVITGEALPLSLPHRRPAPLEGGATFTPADAIARAVLPRRVSRITITGCTGQVMPWLQTRPDVANRLNDSIASFLGPM